MHSTDEMLGARHVGLRLYGKIVLKSSSGRFWGRGNYANFGSSGISMEDPVRVENDGPPVSFKFIEKDSGEVTEVMSARGKKMVDVALDNDVNIEAACGGELACSTCHVVLDQALYDQLPLKKEEEDDMLDLAAGLTKTSRLSCQLEICDAMEGAEVLIPGDWD